jgi:7-carboxy-7-deazaguanine synthase
MIRVFSIFPSIQGESTRAGLATGFLRLAGCPLECSYCDARDACESDGKPYSVEQLVEEALKLGPRLVEVTGGEPLAQEETPLLLSALCDAGLKVMLETSGAFSITEIDSRVRIIMDVKCPGSGMSNRMHMKNISKLTSERQEIKFVVTSREDFDWAAMESTVPFRLQPQLHKIIWKGSEKER